MADVCTLDTRPWRLGQEDYLEYLITDGVLGADLSSPAATATITIYDSTGAISLAATSMTMSGTTRRKSSYFLTSGVGKTLTTTGTYKLFILVSWSDGVNTLKVPIQQALEVRAAGT